MGASGDNIDPLKRLFPKFCANPPKNRGEIRQTADLVVALYSTLQLS